MKLVQTTSMPNPEASVVEEMLRFHRRCLDSLPLHFVTDDSLGSRRDCICWGGEASECSERVFVTIVNEIAELQSD